MEDANMTATNVANSEKDQLAKLVRNVHRNYPSGLTIVTTLEGDRPYGLALSAFSSISLDPPTVMVIVSFTSSNHARFYSADILGVNIVSAEQAGVARQFAQSGADKFSGVAWHKGKFSAPILDQSSGYFEIEVQERILAHTHTIFIGRVLDAGVRDGAVPLIYANGRFYDGGKLVELEGETR
jgi:flavin reductase (DIM6/NTAB) family NADH-FMN oxidoreductase RutF